MGKERVFDPHNKKKIINDPVYGFISVPDALIYDLIAHPYFQRLRRIKQLGMSQLVYPGAIHTRFHHALGAMHLMQLAIESLRGKDVSITAEEEQGALIAILLHDVGHGPYSHSLEYTLVKEVDHERISALLMDRLNTEFDHRLSLGIAIFNNRYSKQFLHQLVSSQLDMDRLDYLMRDSFYTGVSEGVVSNQRIIKMLTVSNDRLAVEEKGIYSIEKFIVARRLMYWQVYLHKTVVSAERLLISILNRARFCALRGDELFGSPAFRKFLYNHYDYAAFANQPDVLDAFVQLDDYDIMGAIKVWMEHPDRILSDLCRRAVYRNLGLVVLANDPFPEKEIADLRHRTAGFFKLNDDEIAYYFQTDRIENHAYNKDVDGIDMLSKSGELVDLAEASDSGALLAQSVTITKYVLYYPKELRRSK